jgi:hypothetical protein
MLKAVDKMAQEELRSKLVWSLAVINLLASVLWVLAAFGVVKGREGVDFLYLAVGVVSLVAGGTWLAQSLRARQGPAGMQPRGPLEREGICQNYRTWK